MKPDNIDSNTNNGLMTKIWGPGAWMMLEACAFGYPMKPTEQDKQNFRAFYDSIQHVLPCKYCRISFSGFLQDHDTKLDDSVLENRKTLTNWIFKMHNKVNNKLGVDYGLTFNDFVNKYESFRAKCVTDKHSVGCNMPLKDKNKAYKMAYNKDFPLLDCEIVCKFIKYSKERGLGEDEFYFHSFYKKMCDKNVNYQDDPNCDMWFRRNNECYDITKKIRTGINMAIEPIGSKYEGLPTVHELRLISRLTTSLTSSELEEVVKKIEKRYKNRRAYYLTSQ